MDKQDKLELENNEENKLVDGFLGANLPEEDEDPYELLYHKLQYEEEVVKAELRKKPSTVISDDTIDSDLYTSCTTKAESFVKMFQTLSGAGIDYTDSIAVSVEILRQEHEKEVNINGGL